MNQNLHLKLSNVYQIEELGILRFHNVCGLVQSILDFDTSKISIIILYSTFIPAGPKHESCYR